jgi:hypothetical protein
MGRVSREQIERYLFLYQHSSWQAVLFDKPIKPDQQRVMQFRASYNLSNKIQRGDVKCKEQVFSNQ